MEVEAVSENPQEKLRESLRKATEMAVGAAGGPIECARKLSDLMPEGESISFQAIYLWTRVPVEGPKGNMVLLMEKIQPYDRHHMRPDVYGPPPGKEGEHG